MVKSFYYRIATFFFIVILCGFAQETTAQLTIDQPVETAFSRDAGSTLTFNLRARDNMGDMPDIKLGSLRRIDNNSDLPGQSVDLNNASCAGLGAAYTINNPVDCVTTSDPNMNGSDFDVATYTLTVPNVSVGTQFEITLAADAPGNGVRPAESVTRTIILTVGNPAAIPALSEWGLFLFFLGMLTLGVVTLFNFQSVPVATTGTALTTPKFQFPFDATTFRQLLPHAVGIAVVLFALIWVFWGTVTGLDVFGVAISTAILVYLMQLVKLMQNK